MGAAALAPLQEAGAGAVRQEEDTWEVSSQRVTGRRNSHAYFL